MPRFRSQPLQRWPGPTLPRPKLWRWLSGITTPWLLVACVACAHDLQSGTNPVASPACTGAGIEVQVLGSGGPIPDDARASAGYVVWIEGHARILVDAGGGTFQRFGAAKANMDDLQAIALTHLHTDHSADLPALLKGMFFGSRTRDLPVFGPGASGAFPSLEEWLAGMFGPGGAYRYLSWLLDEEGAFMLKSRSIDPSLRKPQVLLDESGVRIEAIGVEHGPVPALGYAVFVGTTKIVFSGDQNANNPAFTSLARGADVLVMHHAVPEQADAIARKLHARPSEIAALAAEAAPKHLVLSHHMARSLADLDRSLRLIRARYPGHITVAEDLVCVRAS